MAIGGGVRLLSLDFASSFMWVWSGVLIKMAAYSLVAGLGPHEEFKREIVKCAVSILNLFFFSYLGKLTDGASCNPLTLLPTAISGDFPQFLFNFGARIPAQVIGSIIGVRLILETFPGIGHLYRLNVDIHQGALTEGLIAFAIVIVSLGLTRNMPGSFYRKTWISSVSKLALQVLGSDLTGGCANPATAIGWAYARGDHLTKAHILVYWLAPVVTTVLAGWTFKLVFRPRQGEKPNMKNEKSD
ncbi:probable aquaporin SIP2-1 [Diospyros lotus]|uniref:probable aquaporin SIP2-1 n=1 Tax=Diospyros lotus TaxID=55363 RepID=UPI002252A20E|nr:probable aquaporin SIP2-1 [Diospyros lotus]